VLEPKGWSFWVVQVRPSPEAVIVGARVESELAAKTSSSEFAAGLTLRVL
jgi:hypothetical protein